MSTLAAVTPKRQMLRLLCVCWVLLALPVLVSVQCIAEAHEVASAPLQSERTHDATSAADMFPHRHTPVKSHHRRARANHHPQGNFQPRLHPVEARLRRLAHSTQRRKQEKEQEVLFEPPPVPVQFEDVEEFFYQLEELVEDVVEGQQVIHLMHDHRHDDSVVFWRLCFIALASSIATMAAMAAMSRFVALQKSISLPLGRWSSSQKTSCSPPPPFESGIVVSAPSCTPPRKPAGKPTLTVVRDSRQQAASKSKKCLPCSTCGKAFSQPSMLLAHERIHSDERIYACHLCPKKFVSVSNRNSHLVSHQKSKPFNCSTCGLGFARNSDLTRHKRTHTGLKPHSCGSCGKGFGTSYNLKRHMRTCKKAKPAVANESVVVDADGLPTLDLGALSNFVPIGGDGLMKPVDLDSVASSLDSFCPPSSLFPIDFDFQPLDTSALGEWSSGPNSPSSSPSLPSSRSSSPLDLGWSSSLLDSVCEWRKPVHDAALAELGQRLHLAGLVDEQWLCPVLRRPMWDAVFLRLKGHADLQVMSDQGARSWLLELGNTTCPLTGCQVSEVFVASHVCNSVRHALECHK